MLIVQVAILNKIKIVHNVTLNAVNVIYKQLVVLNVPIHLISSKIQIPVIVALGFLNKANHVSNVNKSLIAIHVIYKIQVYVYRAMQR